MNWKFKEFFIAWSCLRNIYTFVLFLAWHKCWITRSNHEGNLYLFLFSKINVRLLFIKRLVRLEIFKFRDNPRNEFKVSRLKDYINSSKIFLINPIFLRRFSSKERSNRSAIVNLCFPLRPQIFNQFSSKDKCKWGRSCYYLNCHPLC